jgi:hypothetical protein
MLRYREVVKPHEVSVLILFSSCSAQQSTGLTETHMCLPVRECLSVLNVDVVASRCFLQTDHCHNVHAFET